MYRRLLFLFLSLISSAMSAQVLYPPTGVTALARNGSEVTISWNAAANATRYKVRNKTLNTSSPSIYATSHVETGLNAGQQYCFTVISCAAEGNCSTGESAQVCAVPTHPPAAPAGVTTVVASATSIRITWNATANTTRYKVRHTNTNAQTGDLSGTTYEWPNLATNTQHCFEVLACNVPGVCSLPSARVCVMLPPTPAPPVLSATTESSSSIRLSWNSVPNATRYKYRNITTSSDSGDITTTATSVTGLAAGTRYCFHARACNVPNVCSAPSNEVCATTTATQAADAFAFPAGPEDGTGWRGVSGYRFLESAAYSCGTVFHPGFDINKDNAGAADKGEPVYATADGTIVEAYNYGGDWGNVILIHQAAANVWSQYAHLDTMLVQKGQTVTRRQQIGTVGDAGGKFTPHLHFEIRTVSLPANAFPCGQTEQYVRERYTDPIAWIDTH